jgi:hypothetical protein
LDVERAALISRSMASKVDEQMCKTVLERVVLRVFMAGSHSAEMPGMLEERPLKEAATSSHTGSGGDGGGGEGEGGGGEGDGGGGDGDGGGGAGGDGSVFGGDGGE